jgi:hypothetical protein
MKSQFVKFGSYIFNLSHITDIVKVPGDIFYVTTTRIAPMDDTGQTAFVKFEQSHSAYEDVKAFYDSIKPFSELRVEHAGICAQTEKHNFNVGDTVYIIDKGHILNQKEVGVDSESRVLRELDEEVYPISGVIRSLPFDPHVDEVVMELNNGDLRSASLNQISHRVKHEARDLEAENKALREAAHRYLEVNELPDNTTQDEYLEAYDALGRLARKDKPGYEHD